LKEFQRVRSDSPLVTQSEDVEELIDQLEQWQHVEIASILEDCLIRVNDTKKYYKKYVEDMTEKDFEEMDKDLYSRMIVAAKMLRTSKLIRGWRTQKTVTLSLTLTLTIIRGPRRRC